jgi:cell wall-associated NlpC family hydrolase
MWFYSDLQVQLEHSVTAQIHSGKKFDEPIPGDIVAFKYNGSSVGYHNGIYVGNDLFIHSPRVGTRTKVSSVSEYAGKHSEIVFTRIDF